MKTKNGNSPDTMMLELGKVDAHLSPTSGGMCCPDTLVASADMEVGHMDYNGISWHGHIVAQMFVRGKRGNQIHIMTDQHSGRTRPDPGDLCIMAFAWYIWGLFDDVWKKGKISKDIIGPKQMELAISGHGHFI